MYFVPEAAAMYMQVLPDRPFCVFFLTEVFILLRVVVAVGHAVPRDHSDRLSLDGRHLGAGFHHPAPGGGRGTATKVALRVN